MQEQSEERWEMLLKISGADDSEPMLASGTELNYSSLLFRELDLYTRFQVRY